MLYKSHHAKDAQRLLHAPIYESLSVLNRPLKNFSLTACKLHGYFMYLIKESSYKPPKIIPYPESQPPAAHTPSHIQLVFLPFPFLSLSRFA